MNIPKQQSGNLTYLESIRNALYDLLETRTDTLLLGEDLADSYGGAFKATKGLSTAFPDRVLSTPISEAGFTGMATGLALRGFRPIIEIMFGDFLLLAADQIINTMAKFPLMYEQVETPVVIRTPMGGGRGYGPTHSQSLEKHFLGVPGLKVVAPSTLHDPGELLRLGTIHASGPLLFIENKRLYPCKLRKSSNALNLRTLPSSPPEHPIIIAENFDDLCEKPDVVIITYGGLAEDAAVITSRLSDEEIAARLIVLSRLDSYPCISNDLIPLDCLLIIAEEGTAGFGWSAQVECTLRSDNHLLRSPMLHFASKPDIVPAAQEQEREITANKNRLLDLILENL